MATKEKDPAIKKSIIITCLEDELESNVQYFRKDVASWKPNWVSRKELDRLRNRVNYWMTGAFMMTSRLVGCNQTWDHLDVIRTRFQARLDSDYAFACAWLEGGV